MTQHTGSGPFDSTQRVRHTLLGDANILKERFKEETRGTCSVRSLPPSRFPLPQVFILFWGYYAVLCIIGFFLIRFVLHWSSVSLLYAALPVFFAGNIEIAAVHFCRKRFGSLVEISVSSAIRTGIPLVAVLVFYLTIDKMLLRSAILTLFGFYISALPFEVWVFLPRSQAGQIDSTITQTKDERINNGG